MSVWKFEELFRKKKVSDRKVNTTPVIGYEPFLGHGNTRWFESLLLAHSLDAHWRHPWQCVCQVGSELKHTSIWNGSYFLQNELRSGAQLLWETNHMQQMERVCFKTALFLQIANLDLDNEEHDPKAVKVIFKLKDN